MTEITVKRGEIWIANLNPTEGSEQAGIRPVIVFQNDIVSQFTTTVLAIPLTTNLRRASLPTCLLISTGEGGLLQDSVALCYQMRVLDKRRFQSKLGELNSETITRLEEVMLLTLGY
ncbi:type II toxin-antitoxin system PemK/MazF family toxin [Aerosakkonemataceae cyanobacterium BLCC-F154]|uniref:mRNA interferase n=1 Tax=Floridaenema fluviatile BLCC-F154 TaxID=3153640 RepID=A0ABV4YBX9_9CYAN